MPTNEEVYRVSYAVIDAATGAIVRTGFCSLESLHLQPGQGQMVADLPDGVSDDTHYWDGSDFVPLPPQPHPAYVWNGSEWIDPRTPADHQAALYAARAAASMDKSDLLIALVMAGILPSEDAEIAAEGTIPPTIQAVLDGLPPEVFPPEAAMVARIKWRTDTVISRVNPVIVLAAAALGMTEDQMDVLFNVQMPE